MGRKNANPILDSHRYKVEFDDCEVTEITANVIADHMHDKCDTNRNNLLLHGYFIDNKKSKRTMSLQDK